MGSIPGVERPRAKGAELHSDAKASSAVSTKGRATSLGALTVLVVSLAMALGPAQAFAVSDTFTQAGAFGSPTPGAGDGQFQDPKRIAVETSTGNVLVVDSGNHRVEVFHTSGTSGSYLTQFGGATLSSPFGIAVDQTSGAVYVSDPGNEQIVKFDSDGAADPTYPVDGTFTSPPQGSGSGEIGNFQASLAVDPLNGDLLVADSGNNLIQRFDADGTFVSAFDGSSSPYGAFMSVKDLSVDASGNITVVDSENSIVNYIERFDPSGNYQLTLPGPGQFAPESYGQATFGTLLGFDGSTGHTVIGTGLDEVGVHVDTFSGSTKLSQALLIPAGYGNTEIAGLTGIAINGATGYLYGVSAVYSGCCGTNGVQVMKPGTLPAMTLDAPSAVTATDAHFSGTVNPEGADTTWRFEYSEDGSNWEGVPIPAGDAGSGGAAVPVSVDVHTLQPGREYHVRMTATNESGTRTTAEQLFSTEEGPPSVEELPAAPVNVTSARLNGRIDPNGIATTYYFEYGPTSAYGTSLPAGQDADAGSGSEDVIVSGEATGLQPGTTYHFRIVAHSSSGTTSGPDQTFVTRVPAATTLPARGIELVNQPEKGEQNPLTAILARNRDRVAWTVFGGAPGSSNGGGSTFIADRTPEGWKSTSLVPPADQQVGGGYDRYDIAAYTPDLSRFLIVAQQGILTFTEQVLVRLDDQGHQTELASFPPNGGALSFYATDDLSHVFGLVKEPIDPNHVEGTSDVYDFGSGTAELVDRLPDGSVPSCGIPDYNSGSGFGSAGGSPYNWFSATDGSQVYFETTGNNCSLQAPPPDLYVRHRDTETTTLISGPPVAGPSRGGTFVRTNADGSVAIFVSRTRLSPDDLNNTADIYRYIRGSGNECLTCVVANADVSYSEGTLDSDVVASADLSHVYFTSFNRLVPGKGQQVAHNLYVWHDGVIHYISPSGQSGVGPSLAYGAGGGVGLTSDGNVLFFRSHAPGITTDDTGGHDEYYRYDARSGETECVSCAADGSTPTADVQPSPTEGLFAQAAQAFTNDGNTFVFETAAPLVSSDVNGTDDIYEWHNGSIGLVTDGVTDWPRSFGGQLKFLGVSADGANIIFRLGAKLTGYERDEESQIYTARVGGGFPRPPAAPTPCSEDACQGALQAPPGLAAPGSASVVGPGNARPAFRKHHRRHSKRRNRKHHRKHTTRRHG
jgi:NHL repeat-containing protein